MHPKIFLCFFLMSLLLLNACASRSETGGTESDSIPAPAADSSAASAAPGTDISTTAAFSSVSTATATASVTTAKETGEAPVAPQSVDDISSRTRTCYTLQTLYEDRYGLKTAMVLVPYGWQAQLNVEWGIVSTLWPAIATVTLTSPEGLARIEIASAQTYVQQSRNGIAMSEGVYYDFYNIVLNYRQAAQYNDYVLNTLLHTAGSVVKREQPDSVSQRTLDEAAYTYLQSFAGVSNSLDAAEGSSERTSYRISDGSAYQIDIQTAVLAASLSLNTGYAQFNQIFWTVPYIATFTAYSEEALETYAGVFDNVVANSSFCEHFIYVVRKNGEYMAQMIQNYMLQQAYQPSSGDISSWKDDYTDSGSDKFMNEWSDVINERNNYVTEDGNVIQVDTAYDTVYQYEDLIYMGPDGQAPYGWTRLDKQS